MKYVNTKAVKALIKALDKELDEQEIVEAAREGMDAEYIMYLESFHYAQFGKPVSEETEVQISTLLD